MAASFNKVILAGNITRDPELRFTQQGTPVVNFGLAVNRIRSKDSEAVDYFEINAWRGLAETIANHKKKGDGILIEGRLQYRSWEAEDGSRRSKVEVVADNAQFLGRAGNSSSGGSMKQEEQQQGAEVDEEEWDDIPF